MRVTRRNVFETNSSSTHSICITKENTKVDIPDKIWIDLGNYEFGWEYDKYCTAEEKLAYLIFGLTTETYYKDKDKGYKRIMKLLKTVGKWVKSIHIEGLEFICYEGKTYLNTTGGYVDHASDMEDLLDAVLEDEELLKRYLFSTDSFIATGNDNADGYPDIYVKYEYDEYLKGN